jgi:hypothetical protein
LGSITPFRFLMLLRPLSRADVRQPAIENKSGTSPSSMLYMGITGRVTA